MDEEGRHGYLILADISGYTAYLAAVELLHAQSVLAELLELVVNHFKPYLSISKLEGDAVFAYTASALPGETLLQVLESTYLAFKDRIAGIVRRTTCDCNACRAIPTLDLKFIVHYGEFALQNIAGIIELVGSDVNLTHRLMKNHVSESTGWTAYILFTDAALSNLQVKPEGLHEALETYDHLGQVVTCSLDLSARYRELVEERQVSISPDSADHVLSQRVNAPPAVVWAWLNDIQKRLQWEQFDDIRPLVRPGSRMGVGARNHCAHGKNIVTETILDWRPFERYTADYPMGVQSRFLQATPDGATELTVCLKLKAPLPPPLARVAAKLMFRQMKVAGQFDCLARLAAQEAVKIKAASLPEPEADVE